MLALHFYGFIHSLYSLSIGQTSHSFVCPYVLLTSCSKEGSLVGKGDWPLGFMQLLKTTHLSISAAPLPPDPQSPSLDPLDDFVKAAVIAVPAEQEHVLTSLQTSQTARSKMMQCAFTGLQRG